MAYTPELSLEGSQTLRRIAWSLDKPMTETIEIVVKNITMFIDSKKVCAKCKDKSLCSSCIFSDQNHRVCKKSIL
jgi:hypothetical protein